MRASRFAITAILPWLTYALSWAGDEPRAALEQGTRDEQVAALVALEKATRLSPDLAKPLWAFVQAEITRLERPLKAVATAERIPLVGDETSLAQLQADPGKLAGGKLIVLGAVRVANVFRGPAEGLARSHFCLELTPLDERGKKTGVGRACAYLPRSFGGLLLERFATRPGGPITSGIVRLEATLFDPDPRYANLLVATDWQVLQDGSWSAWEFAGLRSAFRVLPKLGRAAVPELIALLAEDAPKRPPVLAETLRTMCLGTLLNLDARERRQAAALVDRELARAKSDAQRTALAKAQAELRKSLAR
jgi:hypothetical protein